MRKLLKSALALLAAAAALSLPCSAQALPPSFFGIAPQTTLTDADASYMAAGRIGSIRVPFSWATVQPTRRGGFDWSGIDPVVELAANHGLAVLPFLYNAPRWVVRKPTTLPIDNPRARAAWTAFVSAAVERYGPGGEFWTERAPGQAAINYLTPIFRPLPIGVWQVWNEANFFYFAYPVSTRRYARLLKLTHAAIRTADPRGQVLLSGLFGDPDETGKRGIDAARFVDALYRVPGIKASFDAVALHPYAFHVEDLEALAEEMRAVLVKHHDRRTGLYITEMGWGSQNDPNVVAFEQGIDGQARELRAAYRFLIANRHRLNLKGTYWYSWKDEPEYVECHFCDSVGLFRAGRHFRPKPAWRAFVRITGGRVRP